MKYPILHLDLNTGKYDEKRSLDDVLNDTLHFWEDLYGSSPSEVTPELRFKGIIRRVAEKAGQLLCLRYPSGDPDGEHHRRQHPLL